MVTVVALLIINVPVQASKMDDRIESSAKKSYVFKTYLKGDDIKIQSKDGGTITTAVRNKHTSNSIIHFILFICNPPFFTAYNFPAIEDSRANQRTNPRMPNIMRKMATI